MSDKTRRLGVVMDPIDAIKPVKDSTLAMLLEAQRRGWQIRYMEQADLFVEDGHLHARTRGLTVADDPQRWYDLAAPAEESPVDAPPPPEEKSMVPAYVTLGIAGAGAVVGSIFGVMALQDKNDYDDGEYTTEKADAVERNALIADMAFGVAITLGVTGIVLLTSGDSQEESVKHTRPLPKKAQLHVAPYVSPYGGGAAARLTF